MSTPPPGFPPHWGSSPNDPPERMQPGQPTPGSYGLQPPYPGHAATPPAAPGYPQPGFGQQLAWASHGAPSAAPTSQQTISWVTFAAIGLLGLLGAILTLTLWINLSSAVNRATDICKRFGGEYSTLCRQQIENVLPSVPPALVTCLFLIVTAGLAAAAGAVMLFLRRQMGQFLILGAGIVMLMLSIGCEARFGATGRITYDLIAGFVIAAAGGLMLIPAFRMALGMAPQLAGGAAPAGIQGGGQWPCGQPPPQQGPAGPGGYPPPHW
ncbi:hypothetical protein [Candidatus Mycobacterium methanotrophicum]|uniref:Uncharacterized protein n=1 Tax=Candidatus Mycobacterium methanotrophicum TaxID=2943498 RepID=A0ABY4QLR2_9MYCO|nr:hypothetical protein [Candidatus Mycobacterium methanotrophicum]UQX10791.1 hypothetical protein M5I08_22960 [Candidatus Mycobacterium methanotrophicum]